MSDAVNFSDELKQTVMVLSTIRAVAHACSPATRLIGNIRCDDIIRSIDELMPLDEFWPGQTRSIKPTHIYCRHDWRDGVSADEVMMGLFAVSMNWQGDALLIGPLTAKEVQEATFHVLTGQNLEKALDPENKSSGCEPT
jgi:hypothetical protein